MDAPRVLISRAEQVIGERWDDYADCVDGAGGEPVPFEVRRFTSSVDLPAHDGILLTAGVDIDPARYRQPQSPRVRAIDPRRDEVEEALIAHALERDVPLFCICRGFQLLNTSHGGSLLQHLEEREPHRARRGADGESIDSGWHDVESEPGSLLASIVGPRALVNSRHHQAVLPDGVAAGLVASGWSPDGVVEALELPDARWALGVQWHPERPEMTGDPALERASLGLFAAFVAACREA